MGYEALHPPVKYVSLVLVLLQALMLETHHSGPLLTWTCFLKVAKGNYVVWVYFLGYDDFGGCHKTGEILFCRIQIAACAG